MIYRKLIVSLLVSKHRLTKIRFGININISNIIITVNFRGPLINILKNLISIFISHKKDIRPSISS